MAACYLSFYAQGRAEVISASLEESKLVNPHAAKAMAEDNMDLAGHFSAPLSAFVGQHFDYLITLSQGVMEAASSVITFEQSLCYAIPDPTALEGSEAEKEAEFRRVRELVKKKMLKFIGQALLEHTEVVA
jgi:arsenate reductase (thioredoxin)